MKTSPIRLKPAPVVTSPFKRRLTALFRSARSAGTAVKHTPNVVRRIGDDIADAWRESARPKA